MKQKIVILPIDDRPCHNKHVIDAMKYYDTIDLVHPNKSILGHFTRSGNVEACAQYFLDECHNANTLIISIDSLLFGGLVQARTAEDNVDMGWYLQLLGILKKLKERNPNLRILAYSVIMRLTTTVTGSDNLSVWEDIFEYSQLTHKAKINSDYQPQLDEVKNRIPEQALRAYLSARQRNHEVNKEVINFVADGVIDYAVLVQEDTTEFGMHIAEQAILKERIQTLKLDNKVVIKNGTDEMVALLLARSLNSNIQTVSIDSTFVDPLFIARYEDRPAIDNFYRSLEVANLVEGVSDYLVIMTPASGKGIDYCFEHHQDTVDSYSFTNHLTSLPQKYIGILDIQDANGGNVSLLEAIVNSIENKEICAYSAWNTASNAIGSFLLDMTIALHQKTNPDYLRHRFIDDALYQGRIRKDVNQWMAENNYDIWGQNDSEELNQKVETLLNLEIEKNPIIKDKRKVRAYLPWGRSFEIEMEDI